MLDYAFLKSHLNYLLRSCSQTTLTRILGFFDHLPPCVYIFYGINVDKKWTFLDYLPHLVNVICGRPHVENYQFVTIMTLVEQNS